MAIAQRDNYLLSKIPQPRGLWDLFCRFYRNFATSKKITAQAAGKFEFEIKSTDNDMNYD